MEHFGDKLESRSEELEREWASLEIRLHDIMNKKIVGFEFDKILADIKLKFDDGTLLEFNSWNAYDDEPYPNNVKVTTPENQNDNLEN